MRLTRHTRHAGINTPYYVIVWLALLFLSHGLKAATVTSGITLSTEQKSVFSGDIIIVDVESVGLLDPLDTSPLFRHADLIRETTGTRIAVIEGRVVEMKIRHMEFVARHTGTAVFGPLKGITLAGEATSNALRVQVQPPADTQWQPRTDDVTATISFKFDRASGESTSDSVTQPVIGQHLIADILLTHRYPIAEEKLTLPDFEGFDVLPQFEERRTFTEDAEQRQIAWRYHLFPKHSGIQPAGQLQWQGTLVKSRTQRATFERTAAFTPPTVEAASDGSRWWLPATNVTLNEAWSKDPRELKAGDEILRTITLSADNVLAHQLPQVTPLDSRAISATFLGQQREHKLQGDTIKAQAVYRYRLVAQSPVPVFLDTVRVFWFNTLTQQPEEAMLPARRINVGLPERADLLADIALNDNLWSNLMLSLRGFDGSIVIWTLTLALLGIVTLILAILEWRARTGHLQTGANTTSTLPSL